jgi:CHAT domain-containing protein
MLRRESSLGEHTAVLVNPGLLSGLAMAGANDALEPGQDDGILTALEVASLDLSHVEMAVLSACETGLGKVAGGEGLLGLQRSFQVSGVQTTVASLWKIPDQETSQLMTDFYNNLWQKKMTKLEALRQAQIKMLREGVTGKDGNRALGSKVKLSTKGQNYDRTPPYYWAAFVLSGDWR